MTTDTSPRVAGPEGLPHDNDINALPDNGKGDLAAGNREAVSGAVPLSSGKLDELRKRVLSATGPDRQLDADLCVALGYVPGQDDLYEVRRHERYVDVLRFGPEGYANLPALTGSIDGAAAILERMLPGSGRHIEWPDSENAAENASALAAIWIGGKEWEESAATEPLAILAAMLTALAEKATRS